METRDLYILSMLELLLIGVDEIDDQYLNDRTCNILSLQYPAESDVVDANNIIAISNILYNNTTRQLLPLDDGMYDLLMVWIQKFKEDYQVGAPITPNINRMIDMSYESEEPVTLAPPKQLIKPLIKLDPKQNMKSDDMLFRDDLFKKRELNSDMFLVRPIYDATPQRKQNVSIPHSYPKLVGTLDKCKFVLNSQAITKGVFNDSNVQIFERDFIQKLISNGTLDPERIFYMVLELKYDGVSVEAEVTDRVISALSRGDTNNNVATDYSQSLKGYKFPKAVGVIDIDKPFGMKFECMIGNIDLSALGEAREKTYKNPRNATTGLLGSTDANRWRDYLTLVPLATSMEIDRLTELEFMNKYYDNGEILRYAVIQGTYKEILFQVKRFVEEAEYVRPIMPFIYDGVVCSFIEPDLIDKLGRVNSVNKYQMAIKFNPQKKMTIFLGYTFSVAQNGVITPVAHYRPVELFGCTHAKTTVHSYKRFQELSLSLGDVVNIELINDVIPYITKAEVNDNELNKNPVIEFPSTCPECDTELVLSKSGKTALCPNHQCHGRRLAIIVNLMNKISFKDFSEESLKAIGTINSLSDLINTKIEDVACLGDTESVNFMNRLQEFMSNPIYDFSVVGALGFTDVSSERWKLILNKVSIQELLLDDGTLRFKLLAIKGIGPNTADTIISELDVYAEDLNTILKMPNVISTLGAKFGKKIRFTGCRDQNLVEELSARGYDINGGGVTKDTDILIIPYEGFYSEKTKKVSKDCVIVDLETFKNNKEVYL